MGTNSTFKNNKGLSIGIPVVDEDGEEKLVMFKENGEAKELPGFPKSQKKVKMRTTAKKERFKAKLKQKGSDELSEIKLKGMPDGLGVLGTLFYVIRGGAAEAHDEKPSGEVEVKLNA